MRNTPLKGLLKKSPIQQKPTHKMPDGTVMAGATHKKKK
jgi:hypothetical protein